MKPNSYWIDSAPIKSFPRLQSDLTVDVLVVGAGITGITTTYLLRKAGISVALTERERVASVDTGHTTAHLTYITDTGLEKLVKDFGRDHAQAVWDAGAAAIAEIDSIVSKEEIECDFSRAPGFLHVPVFGKSRDLDSDDLKREAELARDLGFDADFIQAVPVFDVPGVRYANQAKFHPRKYLRRLVEVISGDGSHIFEHSAAEEFDSERRRANVNGHWISFDRVVIATNNPLVGLGEVSSAMLLQTKLSLYSSSVLGARIPTGSLPIALFWDTADPYHYLRVDRHTEFDYAVFGGEDYKTGQVTDTEKCYTHLANKLRGFAPRAEIDHRWSGQVIMTNDGLPYIGQNAEAQFIATGYCGNGITFGTLAAMMACDWINGRKNPWSQLFEVDRKPIKAGAWDYLHENADYPYYMIKDRLQRPEADSVRDLKPGDGMIVKSKSGKVAAHRDSNGKVHKVSAICTHMGCVVRWNPAEHTWDCPCHGSRFKPTGEVIAGPAEEPLAS